MMVSSFRVSIVAFQEKVRCRWRGDTRMRGHVRFQGIESTDRSFWVMQAIPCAIGASMRRCCIREGVARRRAIPTAFEVDDAAVAHPDYAFFLHISLADRALEW